MTPPLAESSTNTCLVCERVALAKHCRNPHLIAEMDHCVVEGLRGAHDFAEVLTLHVRRQVERFANVLFQQNQGIPRWN